MTSILEVKGGDVLRIQGILHLETRFGNEPLGAIVINAGDDLFSICNLIVTLTGSVIGDLSGHTLTWELIDGDDGITFLTPLNQAVIQFGINVDPAPVFEERTFRFYVDKGTPNEQYDDVTVYATPFSNIKGDLTTVSSEINGYESVVVTLVKKTFSSNVVNSTSGPGPGIPATNHIGIFNECFSVEPMIIANRMTEQSLYSNSDCNSTDYSLVWSSHNCGRTYDSFNRIYEYGDDNLTIEFIVQAKTSTGGWQEVSRIDFNESHHLDGINANTSYRVITSINYFNQQWNYYSKNVWGHHQGYKTLVSLPDYGTAGDTFSGNLLIKDSEIYGFESALVTKINKTFSSNAVVLSTEYSNLPVAINNEIFNFESVLISGGQVGGSP